MIVEIVEDKPDISICPLCAGKNNCALVVSAESSEPCWCESVNISERVLEMIPLEARNVSCLCRDCIALHASETGTK